MDPCDVKWGLFWQRVRRRDATKGLVLFWQGSCLSRAIRARAGKRQWFGGRGSLCIVRTLYQDANLSIYQMVI